MIRATTKVQRPFRRINRNGRRSNEWRKAWRFLKPRLEAAGRTKCEFRFIPHKCWGPLDPAHSKKRREMKANDIYCVAIACRAVHEILDGVNPNLDLGRRMNHEDMERAVLHAIRLAGGLILPEGT